MSWLFTATAQTQIDTPKSCIFIYSVLQNQSLLLSFIYIQSMSNCAFYFYGTLLLVIYYQKRSPH